MISLTKDSIQTPNQTRPHPDLRFFKKCSSHFRIPSANLNKLRLIIGKVYEIVNGQGQCEGDMYMLSVLCFLLVYCYHVSSLYCSDVIMSAMASQITSLRIVYSTFIPAPIKEKKKTRLCVIGFYDPPVTCGFASERASNVENVYIWWRHHVVQANIWWRHHVVQADIFFYLIQGLVCSDLED